MDERIIDNQNKIQNIARIGIITAITCVIAPMSIPIGPVPISLATFIIYVSICLLGWKAAAVSCSMYILIGLVGMPVFSGFSGGIGKILGATGGYIIGFVPMIVLAGIIMDFDGRDKIWVQFFGLIVGTIMCYAIGTGWFCMVTQSTVGKALSLCVFPFIPGDLIKIFLAITVARVLKARLDKA